MTKIITHATIATLAGLTLFGAIPANARHHHYSRYSSGHGHCVRFDKTTGTVAGAVGGGILGSLIGGHGNHTAGTFIGAGAGGLAGHELARGGRKHC